MNWRALGIILVIAVGIVLIIAHRQASPSSANTHAQQEIQTCAKSVNNPDYDPSTCAGSLQNTLNGN